MANRVEWFHVVCGLIRLRIWRAGSMLGTRRRVLILGMPLWCRFLIAVFVDVSDSGTSSLRTTTDLNRLRLPGLMGHIERLQKWETRLLMVNSWPWIQRDCQEPRTSRNQSLAEEQPPHGWGTRTGARQLLAGVQSAVKLRRIGSQEAHVKRNAITQRRAGVDNLAGIQRNGGIPLERVWGDFERCSSACMKSRAFLTFQTCPFAENFSGESEKRR